MLESFSASLLQCMITTEDSMDYEEAEALRKAWGDKPCDHPWWVKETFRGAETGNEFCATCGKFRLKGEHKISK
jgi:hypothetical protein